MKISVLIVAHNEEEWIERSIKSVLNQTQKPDEIVLLAHNCTDKTVEIARKYPEIKIVEYSGEQGQPYARIEGFKNVTGEIICCIDGDAWADRNWVKRMSRVLIKNPKITLAGGRVVYLNSLFLRFAMILQYTIRKFTNSRYNKFASGANFACRKSDYEKVGGIEPIIKLKNELNLFFWAEDYYISKALQTIGKMKIVWDSKVYTYAPEETVSVGAQAELSPKWIHDNAAINNYFKNKKL